MKKRVLSILLAFVLGLGAFPAAAFAAGPEEAHWAQQAVDTLNGIYGDGVFAAVDDPMTEAQAASVLQSMGCSTDAELGEGCLTRGKACDILADVYRLPVGEKSAIAYLNDGNIINGYADGSLGAEDEITRAQFAAVAFRVLNSVGGGKGSSIAVLKPGSREYFAWMYLAARKATAFSADAAAGNIDAVTWNAWADRLKALPEDNPISGFTADFPGAETTKLAAAVQMVEAYIAAGGSATIFSDVLSSQGWYEGVMYLFDRQIINGNGNGTFSPETETPRYQLAVLLARMDGEVFAPDNPADKTYGIRESIKYVTGKGYMAGTLENDTSSWEPDAVWSVSVSRGEAVAALLKQAGVSVTGVNLDILDRFTNDNYSEEDPTAPYMAYAVSRGIISGTNAATLAPDAPVTRGQLGVLAYRALLAPDSTKMRDYADNVRYAKADTQARAYSMRGVAALEKTLILCEDWRLTSDLDLKVPEGTRLTIVGNGYHIYELGGKLQNTGSGVVTFGEGTILYPAAGDTDAEAVAEEGIWDAAESTALMAKRQPLVKIYTVTFNANGGRVDPAQAATGADGRLGFLPVPTRGGYAFNGWFDAAVDGDRVTTDTVFTANKTVYAQWEEISVPLPPIDDHYCTSRCTACGGCTDADCAWYICKDKCLLLDMDFADVEENAWYTEAVEYAYHHGMMEGVGNDLFDIGGTTSRAMLVTILWRLEGQPACGQGKSGTFADVPEDQWYTEAVEWAAARGIVVGYDAVFFGPADPITREQMVTILWRYAQYKGYDVSAGEDADILSYNDAFDVAEYAIPAMQWACGAGIVQGMNDMEGEGMILAPQSRGTRVQIATLMMRFCTKIVQK